MLHRTTITILLSALLATPTLGQELSATKRFRAERGVAGIYLVSLPFTDGLDDVANSDYPDPCDTGTALPDGVLNADDIICTIWGAGELEDRTGTITVLDYLPDCRIVARSAFRLSGTDEVRFIGESFEYRPEFGFQVNVSALSDQPEPDDLVTFTGSCRPPLPSMVLEEHCGRVVLNIPYDSLQQSADELFCGIEGVDWERRNPSDPFSPPDRCEDGLWKSIDSAALTVQRPVNPWDESGIPQGWYGETVFEAGGQRFIGANFAIEEPDTVLFSADPEARTLWEPARDTCPSE